MKLNFVGFDFHWIFYSNEIYFSNEREIRTQSWRKSLKKCGVDTPFIGCYWLLMPTAPSIRIIFIFICKLLTAVVGVQRFKISSTWLMIPAPTFSKLSQTNFSETIFHTSVEFFLSVSCFNFLFAFMISRLQFGATPENVSAPKPSLLASSTKRFNGKWQKTEWWTFVQKRGNGLQLRT